MSETIPKRPDLGPWEPRPDAPPTGATTEDVREAASPPATWRYWEAFPVFAIAVIGSAVLGAPVIFLPDSSGWSFVLAALAGQIAFVTSVLFWVRFVNHGSIAALGRSRRPWRDLALGTGAGLGLVVIGFASAALVLMAAREILGHEPVPPEQIPRSVEGLSLIVAGLVVIVGAPLSEELFFRGFVYKGLRGRFGVWPSALVSAVAFSLVHVDPILIFALFPVGLGLALIYEHRGSLVTAIAAHGVFNLVGFVTIIATR
jgi:membrane protease YdiL (CAAX protease family)